MPKWVKVEFYGLLPKGEAVTDVNGVAVSETLARAFGFTHIDALSAIKVTHTPLKEWKLVKDDERHWRYELIDDVELDDRVASNEGQTDV